MKALFFGSIGTLIETSELQRHAFNMAFAAHNLDWHWERSVYRDMLKVAGGADRIARFAQMRGADVDVARIHQTKSRLLQTALIHGGLSLRPGVVETLNRARAEGVTVALVTTTTRANVEAILEAAANTLSVDVFEHVVTRTDVAAPKPATDCYMQALAALNLHPTDALAIEDNMDGITAAMGAGLRTIAFLGENTADHAPKGAYHVMTDRLEPEAIWDTETLL
ncbi:MAG: HAD-IA family hydrolase [Pseudomonadota bacterium]